MKVSELIEQLQNEDGNRIVVLSSDGEGNNHSPVSGLETASYVALSTYHGDIYPEEITPEMRERGWDDGDLHHGLSGVAALIITPIN